MHTIETAGQIRLDPQCGSPKYLQIAEQIETGVLSGRLAPGTTLPTVRALSEMLGISLVTVAKAYDTLKHRGLIEARVGSGSRVSAHLPREVAAKALSEVMRSAPDNRFVEVRRRAGVRSMASAVPDPELWLGDEFHAEIEATRAVGPWLFYLPPAEGDSMLRASIATMLEAWGVAAEPAGVLVTLGASHGIALACSELLEPGDRVLVEQPAALGRNELIRSLRLEPIPFRTGAFGPDLGSLERAAKSSGARTLFISGGFAASTGVATTADNVASVRKLTADYGLIVLEDASYRDLNYAPSPPLLYHPSGGILLGSFSYALAPGLRLGFVCGKPDLVAKLARRIQFSGESGASIVQAAAARYLDSGALQRHLSRVLPKYRARRDALLESLRRVMPKGVEWTVPAGGLSTWVKLPTLEPNLAERALELGVAVSPGRLLSIEADADQHIRLSFGLLAPRAIEEAVAVLANLVTG